MEIKIKITTLILLLFTPFTTGAQTFKVIESTSTHLKIEFSFEGYYRLKEKIQQGKNFVYIEKNGISFRKPGEPWLPSQSFNFGLPFNTLADIKIINLTQESIPNISVLPFPDSDDKKTDHLNYDQSIYQNNRYFPVLPVSLGSYFIMRYIKAASIVVNPYQYNPVTRDLILNKKILVQINFDPDPHKKVLTAAIRDKLTEDFIESSFINAKESLGFISKPILVNSPAGFSYDTSGHDPKLSPNQRAK
jgi:hypothetical protein